MTSTSLYHVRAEIENPTRQVAYVDRAATDPVARLVDASKYVLRYMTAHFDIEKIEALVCEAYTISPDEVTPLEPEIHIELSGDDYLRFMTSLPDGLIANMTPGRLLNFLIDNEFLDGVFPDE